MHFLAEFEEVLDAPLQSVPVPMKQHSMYKSMAECMPRMSEQEWDQWEVVNWGQPATTQSSSDCDVTGFTHIKPVDPAHRTTGVMTMVTDAKTTKHFLASCKQHQYTVQGAVQTVLGSALAAVMTRGTQTAFIPLTTHLTINFRRFLAHCSIPDDAPGSYSGALNIKGYFSTKIDRDDFWMKSAELIKALHGPLARYVKLRVVHAPGRPGTFSPPPRVSDPDMHHGTCVMHVPWCMPGSLTNGFLWSRSRGKRSRHSRRMHNPQFYVSGKRPMGVYSKKLSKPEEGFVLVPVGYCNNISKNITICGRTKKGVVELSGKSE